MNGTRLWVDVLPAVEDKTVDAVLRKLGCRGDPGRPRADDHHRDEVRNVGHEYLTTLRCVPRSILPSSVLIVASTTSPWCRYFVFLAWPAKNIFHLTSSGNRPTSFCTGFGGADSAVPTGVPVNTRSPADSCWNRASAATAWTGR